MANEKFDLLFKPVLDELDYDAIRADKEDIPGSISRKIVERIIKSEMVIADISDYNPNVFYELAVRNAVKKPVIIIKTSQQKPPFDIQDTRAISVDMSKPRIWQAAISQLKNQIKEAEKNPKQASESILSDFTFQIDVRKEEDVSSEILRRLKDMESSLKFQRFSIQEIKDAMPLEIKFVELDPSMPLKGIDYTYYGKCASCKQSLRIKIPWQADTNKDFSVVAVCTSCGLEHSYKKKDLSPSPLEF